MTRSQLNSATDITLCRKLAKSNKCKFLGQGRNTNYAQFSQQDGSEFDLMLRSLRTAGWPKNLEASLAAQASRLALDSAPNLKHLRDLAKNNGAKFLSKEWRGPDASYLFQLPDGTTVQLRGGLLKLKGWPSDPLRTQNWAEVRAKVSSQATHAELYQEFASCVERHGGTVITPTWQGARIPHEIQLGDGTLRTIKPNQLKNYGWPVVPIEDLQRLAGKHKVKLRRKTTEAGKPLFRLALPAEMHLDAPYVDLRRMLEAGLIADVARALKWARKESLTFIPALWKGLAASYSFEQAGHRVRRELPWLAKARELEHSLVMLSPLKRVATMNGLTLLSTVWKGEDFAYSYQRTTGEIFNSTPADLLKVVRNRRAIERLQREGLLIDPGYYLLSTQWAGLKAQYQWRSATKILVTASLNELRKFRKDEARIIAWTKTHGVKLADSRPMVYREGFTWELPNGEHLLADWPVMHAAASFVLRRKAYLGARTASCITSRDCRELKEAIDARS